MTNENHDEMLLFSPSTGGFRGESNLVVYYKMYTATHIEMRTLRNTESLRDNSLPDKKKWYHRILLYFKTYTCISVNFHNIEAGYMYIYHTKLRLNIYLVPF